MAEQTTYEVNAKLQLKGKFEAQMRRASRAIDPVQRKMMRLAKTVQKYGRAIQGANIHMGQLGRAGAAAGGAAAGGGFVAMAAAGFRFNQAQETAIQNFATMNAFNKVGNNYTKEGASRAELFAANLGLAKSQWQALLTMQKDTPAGVTQLAEMTSAAMAGLAGVKRPMGEIFATLTQISMLGPSLNNDYRQLGGDIMRIVSGGAGQDVLAFRLMRNELFEAVKQSGKLGKNLENNDKFTEKFNTKLSKTQRFNFMEKAMKTLGPEFKKMFEESFTGLWSTTKSKMSQISGAFTKPIRSGFQQFMKRANIDKGGLLSPESLAKFMGIAGYFGNVFAGVTNGFLGKFERSMKYALDNWSAITDKFVLAFNVAITMLKFAIVTSLGRKAAGMFVAAIGAALGGIAKTQAAIKKGGGGMKGMLSNLPKLLGLGALTAAAAAIGVIVAGMAAFIIDNWKKIYGQILEGWDSVNEGLVKVILVGMKLWNALKLMGEAFLGTKNGADSAAKALGVVESILKGLAWFVKIIAMGMKLVNAVVSGLQSILGGLVKGVGHLFQQLGKKDLAAGLFGMGKDFASAGQENRADVADWDAKIAKMDEVINKKPTKREIAEAQKKADDMLAWGKRYLNNKKNQATSGVNINNQYNQWDLRNTDPDRIMSAFVPKLEQMADQRTQSYEALDQGV